MKPTRIISALALSAVAIPAMAQDGQVTLETKHFHDRLIQAANDYKAGNTSQSFAALQELHNRRPHDPEVEGWLGFELLVQNRGAEAVSILEDAAAQRPADLEIADNLGDAYYSAGQYDKALAQYQVVIGANKGMFIPHYNSGNIYLKRDDYVHALVEYRRAAALSPNDTAVQNDLGVSYEKLKDERNAAFCFMKASDLQPDNKTYARNAGLALIRAGRSSESLPYLQRSDQSDPAVGLALGEVYARHGNAAQALHSYEELRGTMSQSSVYWFNLGVMRSDSGDLHGSEQAYRQALEITPNDLDSLTNLGLLLFKKGDYKESEMLFDRLSGLNPSSVAARMDLGSAAAKAGDTHRAIEAWSDVLHSVPNDVKVRVALAELQYDAGDFGDAEDNYQHVLHVDGNNARAFNGIGLIHLRGSKLAAAEAAFRSSIEADPSYVPAYNNLAVTMERRNKKSEAISILQKALSVSPDDPNVRRNLERLKSES